MLRIINAIHIHNLLRKHTDHAPSSVLNQTEDNFMRITMAAFSNVNILAKNTICSLYAYNNINKRWKWLGNGKCDIYGISSSKFRMYVVN